MRMIKKTVRKCLILLMAGILMSGAVPVQAQTQKTYMKKINLSWDLKPGKKVKFQTYWAGIGYKDGLVTLKDYKITDAEEDGYKKLTFTVVFEEDKEGFSPKEVHKLLESDIWEKYEDTGGYYNVTLVDETTGRCLENMSNGRDVTAEISDAVQTGEKKYKDSDGCSLVCYKKTIWKAAVTYPENYKGLCIVAGGANKNVFDYAFDYDGYYAGNVKFGKSVFYSMTNKKVAHAWRVG